MKLIIDSNKAPKAIGPYSQAIEINGMLFISGQVPINPATNEIIQGNIKEQTYQVLKNIEEIIKSAGYQLNDIVKCTCMLKNINDFQDMNKIYSNFFEKNPPARVTFEVSALPQNALIEIDAIAVK